MRNWILLPVALKNPLLHRFREGTNRITGFLWEWRTADADRIARNLHRPFRASEDQTLALLPSIHKVHAQAEVEAFPIIKQAQHHVGSVSSVFPEAQASGCHGSRRTVGPGNEMGAAEQVHEQVS